MTSERDDKPDSLSILWDELNAESEESGEPNFRDRVLPVPFSKPSRREVWLTRLASPFWCTAILGAVAVLLTGIQVKDSDFWPFMLASLLAPTILGLCIGDVFYSHGKRWVVTFIWALGVGLMTPLLQSLLFSIPFNTGEPLEYAVLALERSPSLRLYALLPLFIAGICIVYLRDLHLKYLVPWYEPIRNLRHSQRDLALMLCVGIPSFLILGIAIWSQPSKRVSDWRRQVDTRLMVSRSPEVRKKEEEAIRIFRNPSQKEGEAKFFESQDELLELLEKHGLEAVPDYSTWSLWKAGVKKYGLRPEMAYWDCLRKLRRLHFSVTEKGTPSPDLGALQSAMDEAWNHAKKLKDVENQLLRLRENLPEDSEFLGYFLTRRRYFGNERVAEIRRAKLKRNFLLGTPLSPGQSYTNLRTNRIIESWLDFQDSFQDSPDRPRSEWSDEQLALERKLINLLSWKEYIKKVSYSKSDYVKLTETYITVCRVRRFILEKKRIPQLSDIKLDDLNIELELEPHQDGRGVVVNLKDQQLGWFIENER